MNANIAAIAYIVSGVLFILALRGLSSPVTSRRGNNLGMVKVRPELKSLIDFVNVNLIRDDWPFRERFDVVFCRNVMIYFDASTQRKVLERIHRVMSPGGLLFVGHAENFGESRDLFSLKGKTVYERL